MIRQSERHTTTLTACGTTFSLECSYSSFCIFYLFINDTYVFERVYFSSWHSYPIFGISSEYPTFFDTHYIVLSFITEKRVYIETQVTKHLTQLSQVANLYQKIRNQKLVEIKSLFLPLPMLNSSFIISE